MKLNVENYDEEIPTMISSKLTTEMNTKIVVLTHTPEDALSLKIFSILKREFSVILTQNKASGFNFPIIDLFDVAYIQSFLIYHRIETIVITSEFFLNMNANDLYKSFLEEFKKLLYFCNQKKIKIVFVYIKTLFTYTNDKAEFLGVDEKDNYYNLNEKVVEIVGQYKCNLIIKFSTCYGIHDYHPVIDFPEYVYQNLRQEIPIKYDDLYIIEPVITDEIALFIARNIFEVGVIDVENNKNQTTMYKWALEIAQTRGFKEESLVLIKPDLLQEEKESCNVSSDLSHCEFSSLSDGYETEIKQKKCSFNLVYKLSPTEYFFGERVAKSRIELGASLAKSFEENISSRVDCIVPVPKTGLYYAMGLAEKMGKPYVQALMKDTTEVRSFQVLDPNVRKEIIKNKIIPIQELIRNKIIILVDEAIFTGTTLKVVCKMVRECGAKEIHLGIPTPECRNQCPYYVQPKRSMLLEYVRRDMLQEYFGVESVTFLRDEDFIKKVTTFGNACMKCFSND